MTTQYAMNFVPSNVTSSSYFPTLWKLTRVMKAAGWIYKASGDGNNKDTTGTATNDLWGGSADPLTDTYPSTTISASSDGAPSNSSTINVASTAGFPSSGTFYYVTAGQNITYTGKTATSFTGCTGGTAFVMHTGNPVVFFDTHNAWWCAEGPSTVKLSLTSPSTGTFQRGEIVTQSSTGATGEVLGYVFGTINQVGWIGIMPQTGTFDGTHTITGGTSGATVTPSAYTLIRRQFVFAKDTTGYGGWVFYQAVTDAEIAASSNTLLFSDLAANAANCTATTAPGNSNSGSNRFPSIAISLVGLAEGAAGALFGFGSGFAFGKAQMACVNSTPSTGVSADGSFFCSFYMGNTDYRTFSFMRVDNTEPGDVDPYICWWASSSDIYTLNIGSVSARLNANMYGNSNAWTGGFLTVPANTAAKGFCARTHGPTGFNSGYDRFCGFSLSIVGANISSTPAQGLVSTLKIRNHPDSGGTPPVPIEMFHVQSPTVGLTFRKGICRWLGTVPLGALNDTVDNKKWLVVLANGVNTPAVVIGPIDGSTTPATT